MYLIIFGALLSVFWGSDAAPFSDLIFNIPGLTEKTSFRSYSGYLHSVKGIRLFYWLVESENSPSSDPVVVWFNGGPGCSSMEGMLHEHGPYRIQKDGRTIKLNPYSWNKVANVLYIESPAGVGYSYSEENNYETGDKDVALNNHHALKDFLRKFPEYKNHDFYVTGESYGGIYVPTLATRLADDADFRLKGIAVGNGLSSYAYNDNSVLYFMYYHGFLGGRDWDTLQKACCQGQPRPCDFDGRAKSSESCRRVLEPIQMKVFNGGVNPYNVLASCHGGIKSYGLGSNNIALSHMFRGNSLIHPTNNNVTTFGYGDPDEDVTPPCVDGTDLYTYLNSPQVRSALHVSTKVPHWAFCSGFVSRNYHRDLETVVDYYKDLLAKNVRILVFNGDLDQACNFLGDQWFVNDLQAPLIEAKRAWTVEDESGSTQIAGFVKTFQGISFMTVKGAGHMVPTDKPREALEMFKRFLSGKPY